MRKWIILAIIFILLWNSIYLFNFTKDLFTSNPPVEAKQSPILLVHGSNIGSLVRFSEFSMIPMQQFLSQDLNYDNKGLITEATTCDDLYSDRPIILRTSYFKPFNLDDIDTYSALLTEKINLIHNCTNQEVIVIAHSLGGVVVRNDVPHIKQLITIGSPNQGGLYNIGDIADIVVIMNHTGLEFDSLQLSSRHPFMQDLNQKQPDYPVTTIAGNIDGVGDGLIEVTGAHLPFADNHVVNCGHIALKNPYRCQESYGIVLGTIK